MKHLVIGGAGFIGSNLAYRLLTKGHEVVVLDNLSRKGSELNLEWLKDQKNKNFHFVRADIVKDIDTLNYAVCNADRIYHLAAQVAVTTSVENPRHDFEVNSFGTFNVLEALRIYGCKNASLIYSSTNKVYGGMEDMTVVETKSGYVYKSLPKGIDETTPLDFHSPYGCSKGAGDQYVRDYSRIYGLNTVVFRQSCIYGPRQFGVEDQGWVAWFIIALLCNKKITIYGDGKQVRDVLFIDDLLDAYELALNNIDATKGQVFNIGGGKSNVISIWKDFKPILENLFGKEIEVKYSDWRPGDQKIYISDISSFTRLVGWRPKIKPEVGIDTLYNWAKDNRQLFVKG